MLNFIQMHIWGRKSKKEAKVDQNGVKSVEKEAKGAHKINYKGDAEKRIS